MKIAEMFDKRKNCYSVRTGIHNCWFSLPWMEWNGTSCSSFQPSSSRSKKFIASTFFDNFRNETTWVWGETKWNKNQRETLELVWDGSSQTRCLFFRHEILSLKVPNVKFDFNVSDCTMQAVTDTSDISMRPYNSKQMSNLTYYLDVLFAWLQ